MRIRLVAIAVLWLLVGFLGASFGLYVWPTPYRYEHDGRGRLVRIGRSTGNADVLHPRAGWLPVGAPPAPAPRATPSGKDPYADIFEKP